MKLPYRLNIFSKIVVVLLVLLLPVLVLYTLSNRTTNQVVQDQIQTSNLNQLSFFLHQLDSHIENLSMFPVILANDPYIREFIDKTGASLSDPMKAEARLTEKLSLQSVSSGWSNDLTLVVPGERKVVSSSIYMNGTGTWAWEDPIHSTWTYGFDSSRGTRMGTFIREITEPANAKSVKQANAVFEVRFPVQNISDLLDIYKKDKESDPFLYYPGYSPIFNSTSSKAMVDQLLHQLGGVPLNDIGQRELVIEGQEYLVSYVKSTQLGWYLIDYVPVEKMLSPITKTSHLFYISLGLLLALSVVASFLLYRNVQIPLVQVIRSVQKMKRGDLSARIEYRSKNEFDYLIQHFNEMAGQIQVLVEDVYAEKIRSREATLKQLQSQIHPHFLYNSLFFIINSAELEDREAVVAMAHNLAEFYRYTTRVENQSVRLKDELDMVRNYLNIQNLRMQRLEYQIDVPEAMLGELVPRLILQPLVENAIVHGIEARMGGGRIRITGEQTDERNRLIVEDNGKGLSDPELQQLRARLQEPMSEEIGCGTWNVHHRLYYQFGEGSELSFRHAEGGGLRVMLTWNRERKLPMQGDDTL
ncbi:sensor histidine kinase [Paenibacillus rigui]|uniref:Two-component sensor histidine kinase n=1 Tax=Paenibacillus rigui TaxID=554312 RepID=A0A229UN63_9BACL|nr:sensor histidine kinase [Paenibacillus rigui]OXM84812.1 two-component sensor histidine kinase [Paenibacillus rigui]